MVKDEKVNEGVIVVKRVNLNYHQKKETTIMI
jgi:hypothetical protein